MVAFPFDKPQPLIIWQTGLQDVEQAPILVYHSQATPPNGKRQAELEWCAGAPPSN